MDFDISSSAGMETNFHEDFPYQSEATFSHFGEHASLAAALSNYQPCTSCTPATATRIPHHHHPPGRLNGASATLDGHYCCSWLIHPDQPCYLCFESAEALDNHIKSDHAGKDGVYRCHWQSCGKHDSSRLSTDGTLEPINFANKPKLMRHIHSHTGYKPFPCPFPGCDKGFVTKEQLKNHETTHTKARKFKCSLCDKAFAVKSALTTHVQAVHKEEKTHKCDICGKAFADSSNLSKHKQTHWRESNGGVRKQRARRGTGTESATSTRSTPSISTPHMTPATPVAAMHGYTTAMMRPLAEVAGFMLPPAVPKLGPHAACLPLPSSACCNTGLPSTVTAPCAAPAPTTFDPNCFCCDQACPPPAGPPTPCDSPEDCGLGGFCDLPDCLGEEGGCEGGEACPEAVMYCCEDQLCEAVANPLQWESVLGEEGMQVWEGFEWEGHEHAATGC